MEDRNLSENEPIAPETRLELIELLNRQLVDTMDLGLKLKQATWNAAGDHRRQSQTLFAGLSAELIDFADRMARHLVELGGRPTASPRIVADRSDLREYPRDALTVHDHIEALLSSYSQYEHTTEKLLKVAERDGDKATAMLLRELEACIARNLWFLEVYLEAFTIGSVDETLPVWTPASGSPPKAA